MLLREEVGEEGSQPGAEGAAEEASKLDERVSNRSERGSTESAEAWSPFDELSARPAHLAGGKPEVVIGTDDRVRITDTTLFPWRAICSLRIRAADATSWVGTGWLSSNRVVITAGHCVYMRDHGGWVRSIEVIPGRNGTQMPFGSAVATQLGSVRGWTEAAQTEYDYGAIVLPASNALGQRVGHFGIASQADGELAQGQLNLAGYPGYAEPASTQWWHAQPPSRVEPRLIRYEIDTTEGQSGAPVWRGLGGGRFAVGIHTTGLTTGNWATRIQASVYANISAWASENP
jgi:V8-like Glu-specific endopeptidase